jgi:Uncharacterised nucleotidyltransferase
MTHILGLDDIKHMLLDMISTSKPINTPHMALFSDAGWQILGDMAEQHRLGPILHHHYKERGSDWCLPANVEKHLSASTRQWALRSLLFRQGMANLDGLLTKAAIPYAALKGAWLAPHVYPDAALRPMRDIDIIVPADKALATFTMLMDAGYSRKSGDVAPLDYALENNKHLPILLCPVSRCNIEVHSRLIGEQPPGDLTGTIADTQALLARRIYAVHDGRSIPYLSPTDTLLHLVVHSVYDHQFNNGPLVMNDIAAILKTSTIDWNRFWQMAKAGGWTRGCQLLFAMTKIYHSPLKSATTADEIEALPVDITSTASLLTLMDFDAFAAMSFRRELSRKFWSYRTIAYLWDKAIPQRHVVASFAGLPLISKWVWAYYPAWLTMRCRQVMFRKPGSDLHRDAKRAYQVEQWLQATTPG